MKKNGKEQQNEDTKMKWRPKMTTNITKTSPEVLPSKVPSLGVFDFWLKKMITELIIPKRFLYKKIYKKKLPPPACKKSFLKYL